MYRLRCDLNSGASGRIVSSVSAGSRSPLPGICTIARNGPRDTPTASGVPVIPSLPTSPTSTLLPSLTSMTSETIPSFGEIGKIEFFSLLMHDKVTRKFEKFEVRPNQLIFIIRNREQNHIAYSFARRIRPRTLEQRHRLN